MKALSVLALTLLSSVSFGYGKVGDLANYNLTVVAQGKEVKGQNSMEVLSYDDTTKKFKLRSITVVNGDPQVKDEEADQIFTPDTAKAMIGGCARPLETVVVPAGTFETCRIDLNNEGATGWIGNVPFGIVKVEEANTQQGVTVHVELVSFKDAQ